ncbi:MAG TPA: hypothetical protein VJS64_06335 [Pyrinomonadaceae bacterium]|nr:hypothetical protein [Pyrinomonadaceae bacterium]
MNRNQKIALGCGGAGCLGLIVLAVVGVFGYLTYMKSSSPFANSNSNSPYNFNVNSNDNGNTATADSSDTSSSSMSNDDKHKLFQAAGVTKDSELILKVLKKIGFPSGTGEGYEEFVREHFSWAMKNLDFMQTVNTPEKGRAYVEAHLDE